MLQVKANGVGESVCSLIQRNNRVRQVTAPAKHTQCEEAALGMVFEEVLDGDAHVVWKDFKMKRFDRRSWVVEFDSEGQCHVYRLERNRRRVNM